MSNRLKLADKPKASVNLKVNPSAAEESIENNLLESVLATLMNKEDDASAHSFLEANSRHESCQKLLRMWNW